jgi:hypothetical protein
MLADKLGRRRFGEDTQHINEMKQQLATWRTNDKIIVTFGKKYSFPEDKTTK